MADPLFELDGLSAGYDGRPVVRDLCLQVGAGEVVALLGPNGAGKTTTLSTASGFLPPLGGRIVFDGQRIEGMAPHKRVRAGLLQVPEGRGLVPSLTVAENFRLVRTPQVDPYEIFPVLAPMRNRRAGLLSGGEQQMLGLARALIVGPKLLLIDELSLGLAPLAVTMILRRLRELATDRGLAVLLVEQHVSQALSVSDRAYVLSHGQITVQGTAEDLSQDRQLLESSYMGEHTGSMLTEAAG